MRITLSLDDNVLDEIKTFAQSRGITLGKAVSELVRKGLSPLLQTRLLNDFHVVDLRPGSPRVTIEHVRKLL